MPSVQATSSSISRPLPSEQTSLLPRTLSDQDVSDTSTLVPQQNRIARYVHQHVRSRFVGPAAHAHEHLHAAPESVAPLPAPAFRPSFCDFAWVGIMEATVQFDTGFFFAALCCDLFAPNGPTWINPSAQRHPVAGYASIAGGIMVVMGVAPAVSAAIMATLFFGRAAVNNDVQAHPTFTRTVGYVSSAGLAAASVVGGLVLSNRVRDAQSHTSEGGFGPTYYEAVAPACLLYGFPGFAALGWYGGLMAAAVAQRPFVSRRRRADSQA